MMMFPSNWREAKIDRPTVMLLDHYLGSKAPSAKPVMDRIVNFSAKKEEDMEGLLRMIADQVIHLDNPSQFYELNNFLAEALITGLPVAMIGMPEVLYRMQLGKNHTL